MNNLIKFFILIIFFSGCKKSSPDSTTITKVEMHLSAFGVESDDFPSIDVMIDFSENSSSCHKWFYSPEHEDSTYILNQNEMQSVLKLLENSNLEELKKEYRVLESDQPSSKTIIYTGKNNFAIDDYGLVGEHPLQELYKIVYKY